MKHYLYLAIERGINHGFKYMARRENPRYSRFDD